MKKIRKISIFLAIASILGILGGCGIVQVNPEKDRAQVVAEVNGEEILKGEILDRLDRDKAFYNLTEEAINNKNNKEQVQEIKELILDQIATEKLLNQKAKEAGFIVTDELREEARRELEDVKKNIEEELKEAYEADEDRDEGQEDAEEMDFAKEAEDYINSQIDLLGMTEEEYIEFLAEQKCIEKLYEQTVEGVQVSQEDIDKYYNEELASQKGSAAFMNGGAVTLYEPTKVRVKHIIFELDSEKTSEYQKLITEDKEDEAKDFLDKELEAIKGKADEILDKAKAGEDFEKLVEEVNPDAAEVMKEGIITSQDNIYLPQEYTEAAFKLQEDQISGLVATPYGYYIIKLEEKYPEKTYSLDEKKDDIQELLENEKKNEKWQEVLDGWKEKSIEKFEKRL